MKEKIIITDHKSLTEYSNLIRIDMEYLAQKIAFGCYESEVFDYSQAEEDIKKYLEVLFSINIRGYLNEK